MLLRLIAVVALLGAGAAIFLGLSSNQPVPYFTAAFQGVVAFAVLMALANIVDYLEIIAENSKK